MEFLWFGSLFLGLVYIVIALFFSIKRAKYTTFVWTGIPFVSAVAVMMSLFNGANPIAPVILSILTWFFVTMLFVMLGAKKVSKITIFQPAFIAANIFFFPWNLLAALSGLAIVLLFWRGFYLAVTYIKAMAFQIGSMGVTSIPMVMKNYVNPSDKTPVELSKTETTGTRITQTVMISACWAALVLLVEGMQMATFFS